MTNAQPILIAEYDYPLPDERIAKYPVSPRDSSKLLIYEKGEIEQAVFHDIVDYIPSDTLLVYNNTRVIQARLVFHKPTGARIEIFCLEPLVPSDYQLSLSSANGCVWKCMVGNLKKWKNEPLRLRTNDITLTAELLSSEGNTHSIRFSWDNADCSFAQILDLLGELPIPPYLNRKTEESDKQTYQTVYSHIKGSVAAPTAGLHFTNEVLDRLRAKGVKTTELTLHVGAGTFYPVKTEDANEHKMHTEIISVPRDTIIQIQQHLGHICAVGTTSMRTLESLYYLGCTLHDDVTQFEPYDNLFTLSTYDALQRLIDFLDEHRQDTLHAKTQIMIKPSYQFRVVDMLVTNFHQPKSTLLLLVSAFVGSDWKRIYEYALASNFRFLSYGDSSLLIRNQQ